MPIGFQLSSFAMADLTTERHMLVASDSTNQRKLSKKYKVNQRTSVIVVFVNYISNKNLPIFYIYCFCVFYEYKNVLQCILFYRKINWLPWRRFRSGIILELFFIGISLDMGLSTLLAFQCKRRHFDRNLG